MPETFVMLAPKRHICGNGEKNSHSWRQCGNKLIQKSAVILNMFQNVREKKKFCSLHAFCEILRSNATNKFRTRKTLLCGRNGLRRGVNAHSRILIRETADIAPRAASDVNNDRIG